MSPLPSESWLPNTLTEEELEDMVVRGVLPEKAISRWKCCYGQEFSLEERTEMVVFWSV
jgi:hypothetical protein